MQPIFEKRWNNCKYIITGTRRYSRDLAQGGMEVPCTLHFRCDSKKLQQLIFELLQQMPEDILLVSSSQSDEQKYIPPPAKAIEISEGEETVTNTCNADDIWVTYDRNTLKHSDKKIIEDGSQLTDKHIQLAQTLIRGQFPRIGGLQSTLLQERYHNLPSNSIQVVHCLKRHHWIVASNVLSASGHVHIYDSLHTTTDEESTELVKNMFGTEDSFVNIPKIQIQMGGADCGLFAIAYVTSLAHGDDPSVISYEQIKMRGHLIECFTKGKLIPFPIVAVSD